MKKTPAPTSLVVPLAPVDRRSPRLVAQVLSTPAAVRRALTAAGMKLRGETVAEKKNDAEPDWQLEAWQLYNEVGELRFAANLFASGVSRVELCVTRSDADGATVRVADLPPQDQTPTDLLAMQLMQDLAGDSAQGMSELMRRFGLLLFVTGEAMLVGLPPEDQDSVDATPGVPTPAPRFVDRSEGETGPTEPEYSMQEMTWRVYSRGELRTVNGRLQCGGKEYDADDVLVVRVWRPHPRVFLEADSPVRSSLPVLRELVGLTKHVAASIDSRLAGAGVLVLPTSATVLGASAPEEEGDTNPVVEAIIEGMVTPIRDRDSAAAVVPVIIEVPDEAIGNIQHLTFATPFDAATKDLRDEAIRRCALSWDMPPEQLLGLGESSHWNAWAVQEDTVRLGFVPAASLIADAVVREYLRPALEENGVDAETAADYALEPEAEELISRPNRLDEALALFNAGALSRASLLEAGGYDADDAVADVSDDPAIVMALRMVEAAPSLAVEPGLPALVLQLQQVMSGVVVAPPAPPAAPAAPPAPAPAPEPATPPAAPGPPGNGAPPTPGPVA